MCRFMASVKANEVNTPLWAIDDFEATDCCLELDFLHSKKLEKLVLKGAVAESTEVGEKSGSTSGARATIDDLAIRSCSQNCMVIRQNMHSGKSVKRFCEMLNEVGVVLMDFHKLQNKGTRCATETRDFYVDMVNDGYMKHVNAFGLRLVDTAALQRGGFAVTRQQCCGIEEDTIAEDEFADYYGHLSLQ